MEELIKNIWALPNIQVREFADSVFQVSIGANQQIMEELKRDITMCQALLELMEPELQQRIEANKKRWMQLGIR
ncbi:MAG: hypothetical protein HFI74_00025 [Lachnospiraceae bacterium]|jgi:hypothetical protein|nr:hypothetical protein [Lachnospiraceae bacterium]